jgi:hypothetical protein
MENLGFRAATIEDIDCLLKMKAEYCSCEDVCFSYAEARDSLLDLLRNPAEGNIWLIQLDDVAVGYFILLFGGDDGFVNSAAMVDELFLPCSIKRPDLTKKVIVFAAQICRSNGVRVFHERFGNQWYLKTTWLL